MNNTLSENIIINNELDRMLKTYGIERNDYGFTGSESYRVMMAVILDREDEIKGDETAQGEGIGIIWDDSREFTVMPGKLAAIQRDNSFTLRGWHGFEIDNTDDLAGFGMADALTPEIENGLLNIASEMNALHERAVRLMDMPGPAVKLTDGLKVFLEAKEAFMA